MQRVRGRCRNNTLVFMTLCPLEGGTLIVEDEMMLVCKCEELSANKMVIGSYRILPPEL